MDITENTVHIDIVSKIRTSEGIRYGAFLYTEHLTDAGGPVEQMAYRTELNTWCVQLDLGERGFVGLMASTPVRLARHVLAYLGKPVTGSTLGIEDETRNTERVVAL